jgi:hypothetical protein
MARCSWRAAGVKELGVSYPYCGDTPQCNHFVPYKNICIFF